MYNRFRIIYIVVSLLFILSFIWGIGKDYFESTSSKEQSGINAFDYKLKEKDVPQNTTPPVDIHSTVDEIIDSTVLVSDNIVFLEEFYDKYVLGNGKFNEVASDICTSKMLDYLKESYDYDCATDDCYAIWEFKTGHQDRLGESKLVSVKKMNVEGQEGWFNVEYLDMGIKGVTMVKIVNDGYKPLLDEVVRFSVNGMISEEILGKMIFITPYPEEMGNDDRIDDKVIDFLKTFYAQFMEITPGSLCYMNVWKGNMSTMKSDISALREDFLNCFSENGKNNLAKYIPNDGEQPVKVLGDDFLARDDYKLRLLSSDIIVLRLNDWKTFNYRVGLKYEDTTHFVNFRLIEIKSKIYIDYVCKE